MADEILDPALQRDRAGGATRTGPLHRKIERALAIAAIDDVAAVLRHRGADAGLEQFLDLRDDLGVGGILVETRRVVVDHDPGGRSRNE